MNTETVKAGVSAACVLIVNVAALLGYSLDAGTVADALCVAVMVIATAYGVWKNHNFTSAAQAGQLLVKAIKAGDDETEQTTEADEEAEAGE